MILQWPLSRRKCHHLTIICCLVNELNRQHAVCDNTQTIYIPLLLASNPNFLKPPQIPPHHRSPLPLACWSFSLLPALLWTYSHSTHILLLIVLPFYLHSTDDCTPILLAFYWRFYSHSACILLMIPLPFYSHSTDDSIPILLTFYWWFYSHSTCSLLMILLPFYSNSASGEMMINKTYTTNDFFFLSFGASGDVFCWFLALLIFSPINKCSEWSVEWK